MAGHEPILERTKPLLLVALGGFAGAVCRYGVSLALPGPVPWATLVANVTGSFALGVVVTAPTGSTVVLAAGTGFCGAFTTFSTFAFETVRLVERGERERAAVTATLNLVGALAAVVLGTWIGRVL